jgi:SAM-dependent methyltransferase
MPTSPYIHTGALYDELNSFDSDLPFYRAQCAEAGNPVLELCCGTGRLTIPLARDGVEIEGVDLSASMLDRAAEKAAAAGLDLVLTRGDMRSLRLGRLFAMVFIPFNSLQCIESVDDVAAVLDTVRTHLAPGGRLVFDVFNPDFRYMLDRAEGWHPIRTYTDDDGVEVTVTERCRYDAARQVNQVTWRIVRGGEERIEHLDMRCFYPLEIDALLRLARYRCTARYGDFDGSAYVAGSPKQILVCEPT